MKKIVDAWIDHALQLVNDDLNSYYTYFTIVFAEIAFLWGVFPKLAVPFSYILLASVLNIFVSLYLKCCYKNTKHKNICSIAYVIVFVIIFVIGICFSFVASLILFAIPLLITALLVKIRKVQNHNIISVIFGGAREFVFWLLAQIVAVVLPIAMLTVGIFSTSLAIWLKISILVIYVIVVPFISCFGETFTMYNIFELGKTNAKQDL